MEVVLRDRGLMRIYRIGDSRHALWDGTGTAMVGGRWNSPGRAVIYGSLSYACSMLEILVHANIGRIPTTHGYVVAELPASVTVERHEAQSLPNGWDSTEASIARQFGDRWIEEARSAVLLIPSVVAKLEWNAVVNPSHPDARQISVSQPQAVIWDQRLFGHEK
jgi:RES domain-containing protein